MRSDILEDTQDEIFEKGEDCQREKLAHIFRAVDAKDWEHLDLLLGHGGHGAFWRDRFVELRRLLETGW